MNSSQASVKLSFDKTTTNLISIKLRVTFQREQRRFSFPIKEGVLLTQADYTRLIKFRKAEGGRFGDDIKTLSHLLQTYLDKADDLCKSLTPFTFSAFKQAFYSDGPLRSAGTDVVALLDQKADTLSAEDHPGNAETYRAAARSFERFTQSLPVAERITLLGDDKPILHLSSVTPQLLKTYERWMLSAGKKRRTEQSPAAGAGLTTVSIYTRNLRAIFNEAIEKKLIDASAYPFGKKGYVVPASTNTKKALSKEEVKRIVAYQAEPGSQLQRARDFWVFSYLCNGMNLADIFRLRWKDLDLQKNTLMFLRKKTTETRKSNQVKIVANLFPESLAILARWGNVDKSPSAYVFPFLDDTQSAYRQRQTVKALTKQTNKYMAKIAVELGISGEVNTYSARHSFATILLRSEAPVAFISQSLGHTSLKTTQDYLGSFEDEQTRKYLSNLL